MKAQKSRSYSLQLVKPWLGIVVWMSGNPFLLYKTAIGGNVNWNPLRCYHPMGMIYE